MDAEKLRELILEDVHNHYNDGYGFGREDAKDGIISALKSEIEEVSAHVDIQYLDGLHRALELAEELTNGD